MNPSGRTRVFALLGDPVAHSVSPAMQNAAFRVLGLDAVYVPLRVAGKAVACVLRALAAAGGGGNVTVPHKEAAARAVDRMSGPLPEVCNTFWQDGAIVTGDNTDVEGILGGLEAIGAPRSTWLLIGAGGASRATVAAARRAGAAVAILSRNAARVDTLTEHARVLGVPLGEPDACEVAVNATPLGLRDEDPLPLDPEGWPNLRFGLDLVYRPGTTRWVRALRARGAAADDGREVVVRQGALALERWFPDRRAPIDVMRAAIHAALG